MSEIRKTETALVSPGAPLHDPYAVKQSYGLQTVPDSISSHKNSMVYLIDLQRLSEDTTKEDICLQSEEIKEALQKQKELSKETVKLIKERDISLNSISTWKAIQTVGSYFAFAASAIIGLTTPVSSITATIAVTTGAVGLINRMLSDTNMWKKIASYFTQDRETQEKVTKYADTSTTLILTGLGLFSVTGGLSSTQLLLSSSNFEILKKAGYFGSSLISMTTSYNESSAQSALHIKESALSSIEGERKVNSHIIKEKFDDLKSSENANKSILEQVSQVLKSFINTVKNITKKD